MSSAGGEEGLQIAAKEDFLGDGSGQCGGKDDNGLLPANRGFVEHFEHGMNELVVVAAQMLNDQFGDDGGGHDQRDGDETAKERPGDGGDDLRRRQAEGGGLSGPGGEDGE